MNPDDKREFKFIVGVARAIEPVLNKYNIPAPDPKGGLGMAVTDYAILFGNLLKGKVSDYGLHVKSESADIIRKHLGQEKAQALLGELRSCVESFMNADRKENQQLGR